MNTETVTVHQKGEEFEIIVQHNKSGSAYGMSLSKNAYEQLRQHFVSGRHYWLQKDDLEFAIALQEENRLEAVKWLCEKAKGHSLTPLKDAKDILDAYR